MSGPEGAGTTERCADDKAGNHETSDVGIQRHLSYVSLLPRDTYKMPAMEYCNGVAGRRKSIEIELCPHGVQAARLHHMPDGSPLVAPSISNAISHRAGRSLPAHRVLHLDLTRCPSPTGTDTKGERLEL